MQWEETMARGSGLAGYARRRADGEEAPLHPGAARLLLGRRPLSHSNLRGERQEFAGSPEDEKWCQPVRWHFTKPIPH
jgi:hypothetical protein